MLRRLLVFQAGHDSEPTALVNPEIEWRSDELVIAEEGCLSLPRVSMDVERPLHVTVTGLDVDGEPVRIEASGLEARVLQHEIDHLDGVLILDHAPRAQRKGALRALREGGSYSPPIEDEDGGRRGRASRAAHRRVRTVYLGTSGFAATVLRRLADSPHRPAARRHPARPSQGPRAQDPAAAGRRGGPRARRSSCSRPRASTTSRRSRGSARRAPRRRSSAPSAS